MIKHVSIFPRETGHILQFWTLVLHILDRIKPGKVKGMLEPIKRQLATKDNNLPQFMLGHKDISPITKMGYAYLRDAFGAKGKILCDWLYR